MAYKIIIEEYYAESYLYNEQTMSLIEQHTINALERKNLYWRYFR